MPLIDKATDNGELKQRQPEQELVCVTGTGGFIGSWVVKELLLRGYRVRGTARDLVVSASDCKNAQLLALQGAHERLTLCRANVLDYDGLCAAFRGCKGVFHVASPVSNDPASSLPLLCLLLEVSGFLQGPRTYLLHLHVLLVLQDLVPVTVEGTRNVISAAADAGVRRVVFTSSYGAVHMDPNRSPDTVLDKTCWSDYDFCKNTGNLYYCAKMMAEITATEEAAKRGLELAVVVPSMTMGPMLQPALNFSSSHIARYLTGAKPTYPNAVATYTDVRDVTHTHVLVYEHPEACGRYLCIGAVLHRTHFLQLLSELFSQYHITAKCEDDGKPMAKPYKFSNRRLTDLGLEFTPVRESLYERVTCLQKKGHLPLPVDPLAPKCAYL
ncbi:Dihydroflavonol-4-reductase [Triticum urartu]|uniref:Dihydroflavonol-4-reductase n=1 Tax=Triticum urartu TaxID=4572 RepID=M8ADV2_TRIUA|nr:Dihydroflavonol-4-reductase [Triticum urartu]